MIQIQRKNTLTILVFCSFLFLYQISQAAVNASDIEAALQPFPQASVVNERETSVADYSFALGQMKKNRGLWSPEREQRFSGELSAKTQLISEGHSPQEVFAYYQRLFVNFQARALFTCEARNCGSSNAWANEQFNEKQLYGLDGEQSYAAYELVDEAGLLHYVAIYTVIRGNKRVYAHTEWLQTSNKQNASLAPNAAEVSAHIIDFGFYRVRGIRFQGDSIEIAPELLQAIVTTLQSNRRLNFRVVGHDYSAISLEEQISLSKRKADAFINVLVQEGIAEVRLTGHGVGSLAPAGKPYLDDTDTKGQNAFIDIVAGN